MRYSVEPRDKTYVKGYGLLSFAENIGKNLSNKYRQKLLDGAKKIYNRFNKNYFEKSNSKKMAEATGDLIGNKIADKKTSVSKKSPTELRSKELQNDETEVPKKIPISRRKVTNY